jgi:hypothetical protein
MILLVITGTMGSGKASVLAEASDILALYKIPHSTIDVDAMRGARLGVTGDRDDLMYANLTSVSKNYVGLGLTRFLVARAIENRAELNRCVRAVGADETLGCRLLRTVTR